MPFSRANSGISEKAAAEVVTRMPAVIRFQPVRLGSQQAGEEALLGFTDDLLIAVLARGNEEWFLEVGFGPCSGEGRLFPTLEAAETWIREQVSRNWIAGSI